jgi:hypothetical protein
VRIELILEERIGKGGIPLAWGSKLVYGLFKGYYSIINPGTSTYNQLIPGSS